MKLFSFSSSLSFVSLIVFAVNTFAADTLRIGWEPWEPYQYKDKGSLVGLDIELTTAIVEGAGFKPEFIERPWKRQLEEAKSGKIHLVLAASITPERSEYANFSTPYRKESVSFYILAERKPSLNFASLSEIKTTGFKLGVIRGYYYGAEFDELKKKSEFSSIVKEVGSEDVNYKKLLSKRIDGTMLDSVSAAMYIKSKGLTENIIPIFEVYSDDIYILFSKKTVSQETISAINTSMEKLRSNGTYDKIANKYYGK